MYLLLLILQVTGDLVYMLHTYNKQIQLGRSFEHDAFGHEG